MLLLFYLLQWFQATPVELGTALAQKKIQAEVVSNSKSAHYQNPVLLTLRNTSSGSLEVNIPAGSLFTPGDTTHQGYMSNRDMLVQLAPGESKSVAVSAMCIHAHRASPFNEAPYKYAGKATGKLLQVAELVRDMELYESVTGQLAVWTVSDNEPLEDVTSFNENTRSGLVNRLAAITGRPVPPPPAPDDYERNLQVNPRIKIGGNYDFRLSSTKAIHIAMFNSQNVVVRELYNNPAEPPGQKHIDFFFDADIYQDEVYYFRLLADGVIKLETEMSRD
ncbi:MAG: hypothetical protein ACT6QS_13860 [Flavobacteriales bacterium]